MEQFVKPGIGTNGLELYQQPCVQWKCVTAIRLVQVGLVVVACDPFPGGAAAPGVGLGVGQQPLQRPRSGRGIGARRGPGAGGRGRASGMRSSQTRESE